MERWAASERLQGKGGVGDRSKSPASASQGPHRRGDEAGLAGYPGRYDGFDESVEEDIVKSKWRGDDGRLVGLIPTKYCVPKDCPKHTSAEAGIGNAA